MDPGLATRIAIAVVRDEQRVLVGRRPAGTTLAGLWEFPGGKVEPGETAAEAACRECREETGLEVTVVGQLSETRHAYRHDTVLLTFFDCRPVEPRLPPAPPFQWRHRRDLARLEFPAANRDVLNMLLAAEPVRLRPQANPPGEAD